MEMLMEIVLLQQHSNDWRANQSNCISAQTYVMAADGTTLLQDQTDSNHINGLAPAAPYGPEHTQ
jgi:hypothetical protein